MIFTTVAQRISDSGNDGFATSCQTLLRGLPRIATALLFLLLGVVPVAGGALPETVERLKPSIVAVGTFQKTRSPSFVFRGTGFAVEDGTLIATAAHVLPETLQTEKFETMLILVRVPGVREPQAREAKTVAVDKEHDVALLKITGAPLPAVAFGDPAAVRDGQSIAFTGFPFGSAFGFYPVTHRGVIASLAPIALPRATARELDAHAIQSLKASPFILFQLDATAYPGHSGSPLYDGDSGDVIGVVNMGFLKGAKDAAIGQPSGISFAIPIQYLRDLIRAPR